MNYLKHKANVNSKHNQNKHTTKLSKIGKIKLDYIVCTCHQVTLEEIIYCIKIKGAKNVKDIAKFCDAGSGCGSCVRVQDDIKVKKHKIYLENILSKFKNISTPAPIKNTKSSNKL
jgi:NAD(P)H-nitrite reductase large subunit